MSKSSRSGVSAAVVVLVAILVVGVAATAVYVDNVSSYAPVDSATSNIDNTELTSSSGTSTGASSSSSSSVGTSFSPTYCVDQKAPMGAVFGIRYDDDQSAPVSGANVTMVHGFNSRCGDSQEDILNTTTTAFISSAADWYSLQTWNGGNETITVTYDGQTYHAGLLLVTGDYSCVTLYIPSGMVNSTTGPGVCEVTHSPIVPQRLYNVTFQQMGACSPPVYVAPWSVTLNGSTKTEPPNAIVAASWPESVGGYSAGTEPANVYTIVFSVPDGFYQYAVAPMGAFYHYNGTVTVQDSNVLIMLDGPVISCTTTNGG